MPTCTTDVRQCINSFCVVCAQKVGVVVIDSFALIKHMDGLTSGFRKLRQTDVKQFGQVNQKEKKKHKSVLDMVVNFHGSSEILNFLFQKQR